MNRPFVLLTLVGLIGLTQCALSDPSPTTEYEAMIAGKRYRVQTTIIPIEGTSVAGAIAAPSFLCPYDTDKDSITLLWKDNSFNETQFAIFRKDGAAEWVRAGVVPTNQSVFTDTGLAPNHNYLYRVRATNNQGVSDWSAVTSVWTRLIPAVESTDIIIGDVIDANGQSVPCAAPGTVVTIIGKNFGASGNVSYDHQAVVIQEWKTDHITVKLDGFQPRPYPGLLTVWRQDGRYYATMGFRIGLPPAP